MVVRENQEELPRDFERSCGLPDRELGLPHSEQCTGTVRVALEDSPIGADRFLEGLAGGQRARQQESGLHSMLIAQACLLKRPDREARPPGLLQCDTQAEVGFGMRRVFGNELAQRGDGGVELCSLLERPNLRELTFGAGPAAQGDQGSPQEADQDADGDTIRAEPPHG